MTISSEQQETADRLKLLVSTAAPATTCPTDMAQRVASTGRRSRRRRKFLAIATTTVVAGALAASTLIGHNTFGSWVQPSGAMEPTVKVMDVVVFNRDIEPVRGDVVLVTAENEGYEFQMLSRVVGLPGDKISCPRNEQDHCEGVEVNGTPIADPYLAGLNTKPFPEVTVPSGQMFLLGDQRNAANDSRYIGTLPLNSVIGVAVEIQTPDQEPRPVSGAPRHEAPADGAFDPPGEIPATRTVDG